MDDRLTFRPIEPRDDPAIETVIRSVMPEFNADGPGFAIHDPEVSAMSAAYAGPRSAYFVVEMHDTVVGGGGLGPLLGANEDTAELRKMYFLPHARGKGMGQRLLQHLLQIAQNLRYRRVYLETLQSMDAARRIYERAGFRPLESQLGCTGHHGCNRFYLLDLPNPADPLL